jgi:hypothetical protein
MWWSKENELQGPIEKLLGDMGSLFKYYNKLIN